MDPVSKVAKNITPAMRARQFSSGTFHVSGGLLFCSSCNVPIDDVRKDSCSKHILSGSHRRKVAGKEASIVKERKLQRVVSEVFENQSTQKQHRKMELLSLVKEFCSANIPLYKLDKSSLKLYLERNLKNVGTIPSASYYLRQKYLPTVFDAHMNELKEILKKSSSLAIVCDETTDAEDRYVFNILAVDRLQESTMQDQNRHKLRALLPNSVVLDSTNYKTVSEAVISELCKYEVSFSKISAFVTDNAAYMHKAWSNSLKAVFLNAVHVTCTAHLLNLICEIWQDEFKAVNKLVVAVKKGFTACPSRKARFLHYLIAEGGPLALPPVPVVTRWNTWFEAAMYHVRQSDDYAVFVDEEAEFSSSSIVSSVITLSGCTEVKSDLECLKMYAPHLMEVLRKSETSEVKAHAVAKDLDLLTQWLRVSESSETNSTGKTALRRSHEKLQSYISEGSSARFRQPAAGFFKACQVFDPAHSRITEIDAEFVFRSIPWF
ncbi:uncharacterized protein LOC100903410 [Galendromus occidentalis]|nr:uncharacterized protein LOC100903410 [Galendromus occidentalis]